MCFKFYNSVFTTQVYFQSYNVYIFVYNTTLHAL